MEASLAPLSFAEGATNYSAPIPRFSPYNTTSTHPHRRRLRWQRRSRSRLAKRHHRPGHLHYAGYAGARLANLELAAATAVPTWHIVGVADFSGSGIPGPRLAGFRHPRGNDPLLRRNGGAACKAGNGCKRHPSRLDRSRRRRLQRRRCPRPCLAKRHHSSS